jgi:hypothetical protein
MASAGDTRHKFLVTVSVDGEDLGTFDTSAGGETDSTETRHHPGGMGPEEALGGPATVSLITATRAYKHGRDGPLRHRLRNKAGKTRMRLKKQPLDADGHPAGEPEVFSGVFKRVATPEPDSDSGDFSVLELEMTPDETVG